MTLMTAHQSTFAQTIHIATHVVLSLQSRWLARSHPLHDPHHNIPHREADSKPSMTDTKRFNERFICKTFRPDEQQTQPYAAETWTAPLPVALFERWRNLTQ